MDVGFSTRTKIAKRSGPTRFWWCFDGRVGFGFVTKFLLENPKVKSVTTVEKYPEIIAKMSEFGPIYGEIIISEFYNLPEDKKFDCVVGDIVVEIDARFLDDYVQFKQKAQKLIKPNGVVLAWGKDYFEYLLEK